MKIKYTRDWKRWYAIILLLVISGCSSGGGDSEPIDSDPLDGLWDARSGSLNGTQVPSIPSGELYIYLSGFNSSGVVFSLYIIDDTENCMDLTGPERLISIGGNRYRDDVGDVATLVATGNRLNTILTAGGTRLDLTLEKVTALSVSDLQVCSSDRPREVTPWINLVQTIMDVMLQ